MREPVKTGNEQRDVKPEVREKLTRHGWFWWGHPSGFGFGKNGVSDTIAYKAGVLMVIESKFNVAKPKALQIGFLNSIRAEGGFAFVVNEHNLFALEAFLENFHHSALAVQQGGKPSVEQGATMLDAIKLLTDYPTSIEAFAEEKEKKRRGKKNSDEIDPGPQPIVDDGDDPDNGRAGDGRGESE